MTTTQVALTGARQRLRQLLDAPPLAGVLTSMSDIGARTAARILLEVGAASNVAGSVHLTAQVVSDNALVQVITAWRTAPDR